MSGDLVRLVKLCLYTNSSSFLFHKEKVNPALPAAAAQATTVWQQIEAFRRNREKTLGGKYLSHVLPSIVAGDPPPGTAALK